MEQERQVSAELLRLLRKAGCPTGADQTLPTIGRVMQWLRDCKGVMIDLCYAGFRKEAFTGDDWEYRIYDTEPVDNYLSPTATICADYETAAEAAIAQACRYLIEHSPRTESDERE